VVAALQRQSGTVPIIFINVSDPIGSGFVASLARPAGNITGAMLYEEGITGKWLGLLKETAPHLRRAALMANPISTPYDYFVEGCIALMAERGFRHLPVLDAGKVVGVISIGDVGKDIIRDLEHNVGDLTGYIMRDGPGGLTDERAVAPRMCACGTLLLKSNAAACPQLTEAEFLLRHRKMCQRAMAFQDLNRGTLRYLALGWRGAACCQAMRSRLWCAASRLSAQTLDFVDHHSSAVSSPPR
jgi:CBS domain/ABC transporter substrate binding protein